MKSIFIQIGSYHDYELPNTIKDAIEKSSKNNFINFGIHLSYLKDDIFIPNLSNIKIEKSRAPENIGVGISRYIANSFYNGEDYYLQVDAHTRFIENWDEIMIGCYDKYFREGCNPVITAYPANYWYDGSSIQHDKFSNPIQNIVYDKFRFKKDDFLKTKFIHQTSVFNDPGNIFAKSISGGSVFSSGSIASIEPNKEMFMWGEEMLMSARLFTHGYDIMLPEKQTIAHLYYNHKNKDINNRSLVWEDFPEQSKYLTIKSNNCLFNIMSNKIIGDQELGTQRTLDDYYYYAGIDAESGILF